MTWLDKWHVLKIFPCCDQALGSVTRLPIRRYGRHGEQWKWCQRGAFFQRHRCHRGTSTGDRTDMTSGRRQQGAHVNLLIDLFFCHYSTDYIWFLVGMQFTNDVDFLISIYISLFLGSWCHSASISIHVWVTWAAGDDFHHDIARDIGQQVEAMILEAQQWTARGVGNTEPNNGYKALLILKSLESWVGWQYGVLYCGIALC